MKKIIYLNELQEEIWIKHKMAESVFLIFKYKFNNNTIHKEDEILFEYILCEIEGFSKGVII